MKVFLSSTYLDLIEYREYVINTLERLDLQIERMEIFNAIPKEPTRAALEELEKCDIFVGLYAHRYGMIPEDSEYSITELEYNYAKKLNIPQFCFIIEDNYPWNPELIEKGKKTKLRRFKRKIKKELTVDFFTSPKDLALKVISSITNYFSQKTDKYILPKQTTSNELNLDEIFKFEKKYRNQVGNLNRLVTIPHFDEAPRIHIDNIFVSPNFIRIPKKRKDKPKEYTLSKFFELINRTVVIGDPGAGKSTLAQRICYDLSINYEKKIINNKLLTPVLVVLREFSSKKNQFGYSIIQFMENEVTSKYQFSRSPPENTFEFLLENGRLVIIFDGLDELLDPSHRREITRDIESFCNLFPSIPVLITSRIVGYEQAPLDQDKFETFQIAPFDDAQVNEYVEKWFETNIQFCYGDREKNKEAFLKESEIAIDLRSNPLMLALMCNLYRGAGFIPRNRPELYKKCSEMLFERWDPSRGIWFQLPISEPKILLSRLAFWIYSNEMLQSGVTEAQLIAESKDFLYPRRYETKEEAEKASSEFIEFCRGRAWVFTDVGTTSNGVNLYKFTHKTFLEYFTAVHIVRTNNTPLKLWNLYKPRIAERSWDMVAQLSFQMLHEQVEDASDELIELLLKEASDNINIKWSFLSFGARCLQFILPSPNIIRNITKECVKYILYDSNKPETTKREKFKDIGHIGGLKGFLLNALVSSSKECRKTIASSIQDEVKNYISNEDEKISFLGIQFGLSLRFGLIRWKTSRDIYEFWQNIEIKIFKDNINKIQEMASKKFLIFTYWFTFLKPEDLYDRLNEWYKIENLFVSPFQPLFSIHYTPLIIKILQLSLLDYSKIINTAKYTKNLEEELKFYSLQTKNFGKLVLSHSLPLFSFKRSKKSDYFDPFFTKRVISDKNNYNNIKDPELIFGIWCLVAAILEYFKINKRRDKEFFDLEYMPKPLKNIFLAKTKEIYQEKVMKEMKKYKLKSKEIELIIDWMKNGKSFIF